MFRILLFGTLLYLLCLPYTHQYEIEADEEIKSSDINFDFLIFAQEWPTTVCKYWLHGNGTQCLFPNETQRWTVHGIWPAKNNSSVDFCNSTWAFDPKEIEPIESELEQAWINTYKELGPFSFWKHEWDKHGTCATSLEAFDSQLKYFSKGIEWNKEYSIKDMLQDSHIFPSDERKWNPNRFTNALKRKTKRRAKMGCYEIDGVTYLQELRICFDEHLEVIDCPPPAVDKACTPGLVVYPANATAFESV